MATAYENLVEHLKLAIRQLEQFSKSTNNVDAEELYDLIDRIHPRVRGDSPSRSDYEGI